MFQREKKRDAARSKLNLALGFRAKNTGELRGSVLSRLEELKRNGSPEFEKEKVRGGGVAFLFL